MSDKPEKLIADDGLRLDGRHVDEIRPMKIEIGVLSRADGSCYLEWGRNKILVGVFGPREVHPRRSQRADTAVIRYKYNMASFSTEDRARPGPSRRSIEISKVSREAFEPVIMAELFPKTAIDIFVEVLQADAGTRTAAINASSIALADAGIPMKGLVTSCAFGKVDGQIVLDLNKDEDNYGEADFPVAITQDGEITLLQMDGHLTPDEIKKGLELTKKGCKVILEIQQSVLRKKFETPVEETEEDAKSVEDEVVETEPSLEYSSEAAAIDEVIEEAEEPEETISEETVEACAANEEAHECEKLEEIVKEAEAEAIDEETIEEVVEAEIENEAEEEAFEDESEFEATLEASYEEVPEPEKLAEPEKETVSEDAEIEPSETEKLNEEEIQSEKETQLEAVSVVEEESQFEQEEKLEESQLEEVSQFEEAEIETISPKESEPEVESEPESKKEAPIEQTVEAEEEAEEEKCEGPWKVVKDPSESGSGGENDE
jgi:exosome complex component RRP41